MYFASSTDPPTQYSTRFTVKTTTHSSPHDHKREIPQAVVFCQGHFSPQAAEFVSKNVIQVVTNQVTSDISYETFSKFIKNSFKIVQAEMFKQWQTKWPMSTAGHKSLSGTSATVAMVTSNGDLFVGDVGGNTLFMARVNQESKDISVVKLTNDHVPTNHLEMQKLYKRLGNKFTEHLAPKLATDEFAEKGECCFIWDKGKCQCQPEICDENVAPSVIPMIPLTRSLGDFWSLRSDLKTKIISCDPDTNHIKLKDTGFKHYLVFMSRNLAKLIDREDVRTALSALENGEIQDPTRHLIQTGINKIKKCDLQNSETFKNISILIIPLVPNFKPTSAKLFKTDIEKHSLFCMSQDSPKNLHTLDKCPIVLQHLKVEASEPSGTKTRQTISLEVYKNHRSKKQKKRRHPLKNVAKKLKHVPPNSRPRYKFPLKKSFFWKSSKTILSRHMRNLRLKREHPNRKIFYTTANLDITPLSDTPNSSLNLPNNLNLDWRPARMSAHVILWHKSAPNVIQTNCITETIYAKNKLSLDITSLDHKLLYILFCNTLNLNNQLLGFDKGLVTVSETVKFHHLVPKSISDTNEFGFHISENIIDKLEVLNFANSKLMTICKQTVRKLSRKKENIQICKTTRIENPTDKDENILQKEPEKEFNSYEHNEMKILNDLKNSQTLNATDELLCKQNNGSKTLLFSLEPKDSLKQSITENSLEITEDKSIKVFLVHPQIEEDNKNVYQIKDPNSLRSPIVPLQNLPELAEIIGNKTILPPKSSPGKQKTERLVLSLKRDNYMELNKKRNIDKMAITHSGEMDRGHPKKSKISRDIDAESNRQEEQQNNNRQQQKPIFLKQAKNSVSCSFLARGCGGKCIIPGQVKNVPETVTTKDKQVTAKETIKNNVVAVKVAAMSKTVFKVEGQPDFVLEIPEYSNDKSEPILELKPVAPTSEVDQDFKGDPVPEKIEQAATDVTEVEKITVKGQEDPLKFDDNLSTHDKMEDDKLSVGKISTSPVNLKDLEGFVEGRSIPKVHVTNFEKDVSKDNDPVEQTTSGMKDHAVLSNLPLFGDLSLSLKTEVKNSKTCENKIDFVKAADNDICQENCSPNVIHSKKDHRRDRIIYKTIDGQRIRIDADSIKRQTGKEPEMCFRELKTKVLNERVYDLD